MKVRVLLAAWAFSSMVSAAEIHDCFTTGGGWNTVNVGTELEDASMQGHADLQYVAAANEEVYEVCWNVYLDMGGDQAELGLYELPSPPSTDGATKVGSVLLTASGETEFVCDSTLSWPLTEGNTYALAIVYRDWPSRAYVASFSTSRWTDANTGLGGTLPDTWVDGTLEGKKISMCAQTQPAAGVSTVLIRRGRGR